MVNGELAICHKLSTNESSVQMNLFIHTKPRGSALHAHPVTTAPAMRFIYAHMHFKNIKLVTFCTQMTENPSFLSNVTLLNMCCCISYECIFVSHATSNV